jgi:YHS domain-containing protein
MTFTTNEINSIAGERPMADEATLLDRIDAELSAFDDKVKRSHDEHLQHHRDRQNRLLAFEKQMASLEAVWRPRLDALIQRFGERLSVTPHLVPSSRQVTLDFHSDLARIHLRFSAATDLDVRNLIMNYDLEIIPVLMQYDAHAQAKWPLDAIDHQTVADWLDDRIVDFVKTYLSLHQNQYYLKGHMVEDPIAAVWFPRFRAASTIQWQGKTYYFIDEETRREFEATHEMVSK